VITNVIVGPGIQPQGAVVGPWLSYTPTGTWSTNTTYTGKYRQVGSAMELDVTVVCSGAPTAADLSINLPSGLTIDSTQVSSSANLRYPSFGTALIVDESTRVYVGGLIAGSTSSILRVTHTESGNNGVVSNTQPITFGNLDSVSIRATVPIAEWAGSGTVQLAQNDVEYASNSSATDANDTTSFVYGPQGAVGVLGTTTLTAQRLKTVRFQTPIQATDKLEIEIKDGTGAWLPVYSHPNGNFAYSASGSTEAGMLLDQISSTDVNVYFYAVPTLLTGSSWATVSAGGWRVRKSSAGAAVGFGIADTTSSGLVPSGTYNKSTGAWTLGAASTQLTHTINGALTFGYENASFPTNGHIWRDTSDQMRFNATGGYVFSNDANSVNYGACSSSGGWTFGPPSGLTAGHNIKNSSTTTPALTITNTDTGTTASDGLRIFAGGTTGNSIVIGAFDSGNSVDQFYVKSSGVIGVRTANWGTGGTAIGVSSSLLTTSPSSRRYKENESTLGIDSSKIYDIQVKEFDYIEAKGGAHDFGPMAEDVEAILPEIVWKEDGQAESIRESKMVWLILEEMKKLKTKNDELEARLAALESN
jgi:hypothetical protein